MPAQPSAVPESDRELVISRVIAAPREIDVRPCGEWRFVMHGPDGTDYENCNTYHEVTRPERLVFTHGSDPEGDDASFLVIVTFTEQGGQTLLTMRSAFKTRQARDAVVECGAVELGQQSLARFDAFVATRRTASLANAQGRAGA